MALIKHPFLVSFAGFSELFTQIYWVGWFRMDRKIPPHPSSLRSNPSSQNHRSGNRISASNLSQDPWLIDRKSGEKGTHLVPMTDPWDWYIYLHEWVIFMVNVAKYTIHGSYGWWWCMVNIWTWTFEKLQGFKDGKWRCHILSVNGSWLGFYPSWMQMYMLS